MQSPKEYFRLLNLFYFALMAGQVILGVAMFVASKVNEQPLADPSMRNTFLVVYLSLMVLTILGGRIYLRTQINRIKALNTLSEKLMNYRGSLIVRFALTEGLTIFGIIIFYVTGYELFLAGAGLCFFYFLLLRPTKDKVVTELELSSTDLATLEDPNTSFTP